MTESSEVVMSLEEERETEKRKNNVILYRVSESLSDDVEDRKDGDMAFFHEFCDEGLKIAMSNGDIEQMYRLVRGSRTKWGHCWSSLRTKRQRERLLVWLRD